MGVMESLQTKTKEEEEEEEETSVVLQASGAVELGEEVTGKDVDEPAESSKEVGTRFVVAVGSRGRTRCPRTSFVRGVGVGAKRKQCDSSESEESESESEQWKKRRSGGEDEDEEEEIRGGLRVRSEDAAEYEVKEMQQLLELQLQAAEKREAGVKQRMEAMMAVLSHHMGHMERRVSSLEVEGRAQPPHAAVQVVLLERINVKLEQVMEGFSTLNENLAILSACLSKDLDRSR